MLKKNIREFYKQKRQNLSPQQINKDDDLMLIQFQQLQIDIPALLMTYSPLEKFNEFNPLLITDYCYFKNPNQTLFYPVINMFDDTLMSVVVNDDTEFEVNKYGIAEPINGLDMFPEEIDLILIPLLAFDKHGFRVGYGKGYYDKFLKECRDDVVKIGFSYFEPVEAIDDVHAFDVKLDYCITPNATFTF
jgi:5-formyltetrahydrofolate cyclo-ligase